jgi:uncharacterized protein YgiM (DUF1202 family)
MRAGRRHFRWGTALFVALWALAGGSITEINVARASDAPEADTEAFVRVFVEQSEFRAGPGVSYRVIYRAHRGEAFPVIGRESSGYWFGVYLPDGRVAYALGDTVEVIAVGEDDASVNRPGFFAPPALDEASGGMTLAGGVFDLEAYAEAKAVIVLAPALSLEPYAGLVMSPAGRGLLYGGGVTFNLVPDFAIAPYLHLGGGGFKFFANEDAFLPNDEATFHARAGGGVLVSLRWRILMRLEATNTVLFTADSNHNVQSYVAGLGTYF